MENKEKFVQFDIWCKKCKDWKRDETTDPCNSCMADPVNVNSTKPTHWTSRDE